ncbi:DUF6624 domain-containing protein [Streptomyces niveus]|uniref:DUF6624 domain-containing protein n=1 Tax=Streptomyces niveus TaxID=193462 RepID=UPI0033DD8289
MNDVVHETASVFLFARYGARWKLCLLSYPRLAGQRAAGSHVEPGESPEHAAVRETREKTGLHPRLLAPLSPAGCPHPLAPTAWHIAESPAAPDSRCPHPHRDHIFVGVADRPLHPVAEAGHTVHWVFAADLPDQEISHDTLIMGTALFDTIEAAAALRQPPARDETLAAELVHRQEADQALRTLPPAQRSADWNESVARVDQANTARLREIIATHGWPGHALIGPRAASAAWLIAQHADRDPDFQRTCLDLLATSVTAGDAYHQHGALLLDRVQIAQGQPQTFGTQLTSGADGSLAPYPLRDPAAVDELRAAWGFDPLAAYIEQVSASRT